MDSLVSSNVPVVLITGFGPFRSVLNNPSWEVAKALKAYLEWQRPIHIILEEMHVTYDDVSTRIPDYWLKYNPTLVIHIGVAVGTKEIQIERCACNIDYCYQDNDGCLPEDGRCVKKDAPPMLTTLLPVDDICAKVQRRTNMPVSVSNDAGRFLCEFIYYQSLFIDRKRTIFIHIPELDENNTIENLAKTIQLIIYELLHYVDPLPILNQDGNYFINSNLQKNSYIYEMKNFN
ncbi:unnamed protein product [Rotaria sordida]|uniref:Pyroglutamyl-peptidase I n=1 Tax=Rotaria sordida TaxID=392033 RepID=A0A813XIR9_9BILA|nr:unnamed protein product [Rotaria sordida]CAF1181711.1 unnamed protein product [Rotaria sordida]CAF3618805.1 unnamed protein product [Rotaria sordida]CAF3655788.1 unnamed protein product [Rotaria sordida]